MRYGLGLGYDQQRCDGIAHNLDCDAAWVYALPPEALEDGNVDALARQVAAIDGALFFGHSCLDQVTPHDLERVLRVAGRPWVERILLDGEAEEGNQQTTLTLWGMSMRLKGGAEPQAISNEAVYEKHQSTGRASHVEKGHGASLVMGPMLTERQLEDMWRIYLDRFLWLGSLHPVSMEDPEEDWRRLVTGDGVLCSIYSEEAKIACFTYVLDSTQPLYWLNAEFLENQRDPDDPAASLLFFPGIVASESSIGYSRPTISLLAEAYARAGVSGRVLFENTNRSEAYVPRLLELVLQHGGWHEFSPAEIVDKTTYRVLTLG